jgi:hypothetical protein
MRWSGIRRNAEIQGMPLVIIIMVIVAVIVLGIIIGWFVFIDDDDISKQLKIDKSSLPTVVEGETDTIEITVTDAEKNTVEGATISATGCGIDCFGTDKGNGVYEIDCTNANLFGDTTGTLSVKAEKSGYTSDSCEIVVRKAT